MINPNVHVSTAGFIVSSKVKQKKPPKGLDYVPDGGSGRD